MSKTNHPRIKGTHKVGHVDRDWKLENARPGWSVFGETASNLRQAAKADIETGLAMMAAPLDHDEHFAECLSEWEYLGEFEPMAEWEILLLTPAGNEHAEDACWTTATTKASIGDYIDADPGFDCDDETDDGTEASDWSPWMQGTVAEAFPDYQFSVEGPSATREAPVRASGYYRVYEAARLLDVNTSDLIYVLRTIESEWVAGASAYVAKPVIDRLAKEGLVAEIFGRRTKKTWSEQLSAIHASLDRKSEYALVGSR